jgi:hypothetical protein
MWRWKKKQSPAAAATRPAWMNELEFEVPTSPDLHVAGDEAWEKMMEPVGVNVEAGPFKLKAKMRSWPMSPVPLSVAGVVCLLGLYVVGAPMWAMLTGMLTGMLLPFAMAVAWSVLRTRSYRG